MAIYWLIVDLTLVVIKWEEIFVNISKEMTENAYYYYSV
jgi:hypothetical protein